MIIYFALVLVVEPLVLSAYCLFIYLLRSVQSIPKKKHEMKNPQRRLKCTKWKKPGCPILCKYFCNKIMHKMCT